MRYVSTRGQAPALGFLDAMLAGLARDGGLYAPETLPAMPHERIAALAGLPYAQAAVEIVRPFVGGEIAEADLSEMSAAAYAHFRHAAKAPIAQIGDNLFLLELFHGPTLAFKDFAMQWLGRAMNHALERRGARATILGATSGDTGAAAIEAFGGGARTDVFILYPQGRVSDVQRRQMTTVDRPGVHAIAVEGSFDDCQDIVKALFNDLAFRDETGAARRQFDQLGAHPRPDRLLLHLRGRARRPHRAVSFAVPTGNFGDVLAGFYAKRMGLPVERLVIATNENDILARALATGDYKPLGVKPTQSPSMDIQVSSNFERLLFEASAATPSAVRALMARAAAAGGFTIAPRRCLSSAPSSTPTAPASANATARWRASVGERALIDPHTAVGVHAARAALKRDPATPVIALATAHPAKFPDAVKRRPGCGRRCPPHLADIVRKPERFAGSAQRRARGRRLLRARARATA